MVFLVETPRLIDMCRQEKGLRDFDGIVAGYMSNIELTGQKRVEVLHGNNGVNAVWLIASCLQTQVFIVCDIVKMP